VPLGDAELQRGADPAHAFYAALGYRVTATSYVLRKELGLPKMSQSERIRLGRTGSVAI